MEKENNYDNQEKFNIQMIAIIICSVINTIIGVFSGTFLVANLYSTNSDPIFTISTYYLCDFLALLTFYFILAHFGENVKVREWIYRIGIIIKGVFVLLIVIMKSEFQTYIYLFAVISGMGDAFYWSSYSLMRYSVVRRKMINKFTLAEQLTGKCASILVPIILGSLIDIQSFVKIAFPVLIFSFIQVIFSFFVKSNQVKKSSFNITKFWKKLYLDKNSRQFRKIYMSFLVDGTRGAMGTMITIFIMMFFDKSNSSLGIISSLISVCSMILLLVYTSNKAIKESGYTYLYMCIFPLIACLTMIFYPSKITLIIYNIAFTTTSDIMTYGLDTARISILKLKNYHSETLEHNVTAEIHLDFGRFFSYGFMLFIGIFGKNNIEFWLRLSLVVYITMFIVVNILNYSLQKDYKRILEEHNKQKELAENKNNTDKSM